jgi:hypothetical protein
MLLSSDKETLTPSLYSYAFLILYGIALATEVWGVIASQVMNPPFVGAAICASTLVIAFSFAISRPCLTLKVGTFVQNKQTLVD